MSAALPPIRKLVASHASKASLAGAHIQSHVHDVSVTVMHQPRRDGRRVFSTFRVFYKRHVRLSHNTRLDVQGDVAIMRVASKNRQSVVNMRRSDREISDFIAAMIAPKLRAFQGPHRTPLTSQVFVMPR
ncbi:hypothetical protein B0H10DRAFT_1959022 [Mycena sp. CBHHK59/15]|nr:hypothetical protein B0H10DRAFT_1959022 [Mycena sp. CBHHK59/15]